MTYATTTSVTTTTSISSSTTTSGTVTNATIFGLDLERFENDSNETIVLLEELENVMNITDNITGNLSVHEAGNISNASILLDFEEVDFLSNYSNASNFTEYDEDDDR